MTNQLEAERKLYAEDIRHLIVMQTQFGWNGETSIKLEEIQRLVERGWVTESEENWEYDITDDGEHVIASALSLPGTAAHRVVSDEDVERALDAARAADTHPRFVGYRHCAMRAALESLAPAQHLTWQQMFDACEAYQSHVNGVRHDADPADETNVAVQKAFEAIGTKPAQPSMPVGAFSAKYADVLGPFVRLMDRELHANSGKGDRPGWLSMDRKTALLEIYYHLAKLQKAAKNDDADGIREYAADVANMSMMLVDVCGLLTAAHDGKGNGNG